MEPWVGKIALHYHAPSRQFLGEFDHKPMQFLFWKNYPATE
jgi:hypothetical protein